ncbi:MAG: geranylgeranyl reductase family protein [Candidatus Hodarchaeota archaeon]
MGSDFEYFDICIIGGSIAGNYLCSLLANTNLKISVIEEHQQIGLPFQCAGIVSQKLAKITQIPKKIILNRVKVAKIISPSGNYIKLSGDEHPFIIDRVALDNYFYDEAKKNPNIVYFLGEKFKNFKYNNKRNKKFVIIETSRRFIKAKMLIGCDGPLSLVGKHLNIQNEILYAMQIRVKGNFDENEAVLYFNKNWKEFFGWIVPEGSKVYRVGLAALPPIKSKFSYFLKKIGAKLEQKIDQQGGIIPFGLMNKLAFNNILLLGDAAGQVKATTGGGIIMLLTAAKLASNCIKMCFKENNFSKSFIKKKYEKPCQFSIGKELKTHYLIRLILERFSNNDFETFFKVVNTHHIENLISIYGDMDFPTKMIIELLKNPMVLKFLFQFIIKNPFIFFKALRLLK